MLAQPRVLLISSDEAESNALEEVLSEYVNLQNARNLSEAENMLEDDEYDAVFCGRSFHQGAWNDALEEIQPGRDSATISPPAGDHFQPDGG